jgi:hypothetical protein
MPQSGAATATWGVHALLGADGRIDHPLLGRLRLPGRDEPFDRGPEPGERRIGDPFGSRADHHLGRTAVDRRERRIRAEDRAVGRPTGDEVARVLGERAELALLGGDRLPSEHELGDVTTDREHARDLAGSVALGADLHVVDARRPTWDMDVDRAGLTGTERSSDQAFVLGHLVRVQRGRLGRAATDHSAGPVPEAQIAVGDRAIRPVSHDAVGRVLRQGTEVGLALLERPLDAADGGDVAGGDHVPDQQVGRVCVGSSAEEELGDPVVGEEAGVLAEAIGAGPTDRRSRSLALGPERRDVEESCSDTTARLDPGEHTERRVRVADDEIEIEADQRVVGRLDPLQRPRRQRVAV